MLGDDIAFGLTEMQWQADSMMHDQCVITRRTDGKVWDDSTGRYDRPTQDVYSGQCRVKAQDVQPTNPVAGEAEYNESGYVVSIPIWVDVEVRTGDIVTVTSAINPRLNGRVLTVLSEPASSDQTARRLAVKEVT